MGRISSLRKERLTFPLSPDLLKMARLGPISKAASVKEPGAGETFTQLQEFYPLFNLLYYRKQEALLGSIFGYETESCLSGRGKNIQKTMSSNVMLNH